MRIFKPALVAASLVIVGLVGCNRPAEYSDTAQSVELAAPRKADEAAIGGKPTPAAARNAAAAAAASAPMLAYSHRASLEVPAGRVRPLMAAHQQVCERAGPALCQVMGANVESDRGAEKAELELRAEPAWLARFRSGLEGDARKAGGRVTATRVETEDLTRSIIDTEAQLRARTALRDRLQALLEQRPGKLSDLLEVERELARVQGEIDAGQSELNHMRGRVRTSVLTLTYTSAGQALSGRTAEPLVKAVTGAFGIFVWGLAAIVIAVAFLAPFALIGVPLFLWWRRRRRARVPVAPPPA